MTTGIAIFAAGLASVIVGHVWYHPRMFGRFWMREANVSPHMADWAARHVHLSMIVALGSGMAVAALIVYLAPAVAVADTADVLLLALALWLGTALPLHLHTLLWEHKSLALTALNAGYWLIVFMMSAIIVSA